LYAVFVQVVWVSIGSRNYDGAVCHERLDESSQDHGVCYICALKLVKAEYGRAFGDACCNEWNGVYVVAVLHLHLVQVFVYALHESVKMYAGLVCNVWR
jgi:hypothetical protein